MRSKMLKLIREILKDMIEILESKERENERIYEQYLTENNPNLTQKDTNAESSNHSNDTHIADINYFPEHSHYNPYRNNR